LLLVGKVVASARRATSGFAGMRDMRARSRASPCNGAFQRRVSALRRFAPGRTAKLFGARQERLRDPVAVTKLVPTRRLPTNAGTSSRADARSFETAAIPSEALRGRGQDDCRGDRPGRRPCSGRRRGLRPQARLRLPLTRRDLYPSGGGETRTETSEGEAVSRETSRSSCSLRLCGTDGPTASASGPTKCARGGHTFGESMAGRGKPLGR